MLRIEAISDRFGSPTDPVLRIERVTVDPQGQENVSGVANLDDTDPAANNDPARLFQPVSGDNGVRSRSRSRASRSPNAIPSIAARIRSAWVCPRSSPM